MIAVTHNHAWHAKTSKIKVINTVGAGDATLAGFLSAVAADTQAEAADASGVGFDVAKGVSAAVQWGAVAVQQPTSGLQNLDGMPEVFLVENPDRSVPLDEPAHI
jgi:1-phosphofructokinase